MLDFFYYLFIYPLQSVMKILLNIAYTLTGSYGISLILLSIGVTIALAPFYHLAEGWQKLERDIQRRMAPKLLEIKSAFTGQERHMMLRTLYRQSGYSPLYALRASAGLLIQIPFFIAAYQLVTSTNAFQGASFAFITDLGKPDALFSFNGLTINVLPFVMTGANIFSAHIYTTGFLPKERLQLYLLAGLFLVLLYSAPAALLLYWTSNNILSIVKNILYHNFFPASSCVKSVPEVPTTQSSTTSAKLTAPLVPSGKKDIILFLLCASFFIAGVILQKKMGSVLIPQAAMATALLTGTLACGIRLRLIARSYSPFQGFWAITLLFIILVSISTAGLTSFKKTSSLDGWIYFRLFACSIGVLAGYLVMQPPLSYLLCKIHTFARKKITYTASLRLATASVALAAILLFCYTPALLYVSDPDFYYEPLAALSARCMLYAFLFFAVFRGFITILPPLTKPFYALTMAFFSIGFVLFAFAATADYGTMDGFLLQNPGILKTRWAPAVDVFVYFLCTVVLYAFLRLHKVSLLIKSIQALACALVSVAIFTLWGLPMTLPEEDKTGASKLPEYTDRLFGLTPTGKNVVVFMLDMFTGSHVQTLLDQDVTLAPALDGFIWYPDTISPGATTLLSIAAMTGGENYTPEAINSKNPSSLVDAMHEGFAVLPKLFVPKGYDVALADLEEMVPEKLERIVQEAQKSLLIGKSIMTAYTDFWREQHNLPSPLPESQAPFLASFGLFKSAPWVLRNHIYYDGSWLNTQTLVHNPSEGPWALIDSLPKISNAHAQKNTLKFIVSQVTHYPWRLDEATCMPLASNTKTTKNHIILEHLVTERCSLQGIVRWVAWMKENNVYDNTLLILVSDHDGNDSPIFDENFDDLRRPRTPWKPDALLLIKPFNATGPLRISYDLMSSADILPIICEQTKDCQNMLPAQNISATPRIRTHSAGLASIRRHEKNKFTITSFQVNGTRKERAHWKELP